MAESAAGPPVIPPSIDVEEELTGPINNIRRKDELVSIAKAINIPGYDTPDLNALTKAKLLPLIQDHLRTESARLSINPRFQKLYSYGTRSNARGPRAPAKNSAHKSAEDAVEQSKPPADVGGAHKTLLQAKHTTDPPGQKRHYQAMVTRSGNPSTELSKVAPSRRSDSLSPVPSSPPPAPRDVESATQMQTPQTVTKDEWPDGFRTSQASPLDLHGHLSDDDPASPAPLEFASDNAQHQQGLPSTPPKTKGPKYELRVNLRDYDGRRDPQEAWLVAGGGTGIPIEVRKSPNSQESQFYGRLSDIVPAALEQDTPLRNNKGGRVWRAAASGDQGKTNIGSIDALIIEKKTRPLRLSRVNDYLLTRLADGALSCDIFIQYQSGEREIDILPVSKNSSSTQSSRPDNRSLDSEPPSPTPVGNPRVKAKRSGSETKNSDKPTASREEVIAFLRRELEAPKEWPRAETAGQCLARYVAVQDAWTYLRSGLKVKQPPGGGWRFPDDNNKLPGAKFVREDVLEALNIKKGTASADQNLFKVEHDDQEDLKDWIDDPDDPRLKAKFAALSINQLKEWKTRHSGASTERLTTHAASRNSKIKVRHGNKNKRGHGNVSSDYSSGQKSSDSEVESVKAQKSNRNGSSHKKHKRRKEDYLSDDLDV